ncbi:hypothetical protein PQE75_gp128 [Bacillus phage vB_BcoS-136]|uniref:Lipoprotein n=1 Tax=Bacillus phage vB_BcoS-136 TaxID=2419619 RepID=A0A3G3BWA2_9CAUD|nr:hypothetical protein PQE75_gp128 [Bacillus phage vB_BcoS-136]AYP68351.1 hypothetical protein vBBcoS136_00237 [Bacillus phage vB_BcoS-136]
MKIKYIFLLLITALFLAGCDSTDYNKSVSEEIQIEIAKEFDVPISHIKVEVVKNDRWRFTVKKFLINIKGQDKTYMYIGNENVGYELLVYDE